MKAEDLVRIKKLWEEVEPSVDELLELLKTCDHHNVDGTSAIGHVGHQAKCQICCRTWQ